MRLINKFFKQITIRVLQKKYLYQRSHVDKLIRRGHRLEDHGDIGGALGEYRKAIRINPEYPLAYLSLGNAYLSLNFIEDAITSYQKAIALDPGYASAYYNLGHAWRQLGNLENAVSCYQKALQYNREHISILIALGTAYEQLNQTGQAILQYEAALKINPNMLEANFLLGEAHRKNGQLTQAIVCYRNVLLLDPEHVDSIFGLGMALKESGNEAEAIKQLNIALQFKSEHVAAINKALGDIFTRSHQYGEAIECYRKAVASDPTFVSAYHEMGNILLLGGQSDLALNNYQKSLAINDMHYGSRFGMLSAQLKGVYESDREMSKARDKFADQLAELEAFLGRYPDAQFDPRVAGYFPFYLAYHEKNNRELLSRFGNLLTRLMGSWYQQQKFNRGGVVGSGKIRVVIVSAHIRNHSVWWAITKGLIYNLDSTNFDIFLVGVGKESEATLAKNHVADLVSGEFNLKEWIEKIHNISPDILIYPEIGMDSMTIMLACLKLAPTQIVAWGHPETTGIPTIDYYWSSEMFEPDMAKNNYSEQILPLPNLGCWYSSMDVPVVEINLSNLGIDAEVPILICPGTSMKYTPQYDQILIEIASRLRECRFIFFKHPPSLYQLFYPANQLKIRMENSFTNAHLKFDDFVVYIPWQNRSEFYALLKRADIMLDTIGFSGFNTVIQAIECDLPVVTMDGQYMRGRLGAGILKRMKLTETIANNQEEYIDLAVRLVQDTSYRKTVRSKIKESKHLLFEDTAPIRWLEKFFIERVAITRANSLADSRTV